MNVVCCFVCGADGCRAERLKRAGAYWADCIVCGPYEIGAPAIKALDQYRRLLPVCPKRVASWLRQQEGTSPPRIELKTLDELCRPPILAKPDIAPG